MADQQPQPLCDRPAGNAHEGPRCDKLAVFSYMWEWGEKGVCCAEHAMLLTQTAQQIGRMVQIVALPNLPAAPLQRDERTKLIAERLSAEAELEEVKARSLQLYTANVDLARQVQTFSLQHREARAQVEDANRELGRLRSDLEESDSHRAELVQENERLRTVAAFVPPPPAGPSRHVVEGGPPSTNPNG